MLHPIQFSAPYPVNLNIPQVRIKPDKPNKGRRKRSVEQFGIRKGLSTEYAAFKLIDNVLKAIHQRRRIFRDLVKVSDRGNHKIQLAKLSFYGIQGTTANWFVSYLTNRKEKVGKIPYTMGAPREVARDE
jgi:hypothetical protein